MIKLYFVITKYNNKTFYCTIYLNKLINKVNYDNINKII